MRMDIKCIKAILVTTSELSDKSTDIIINENSHSSYPYLKDFTLKEIFYNAELCKENGLFSPKSHEDITGSFVITGLSNSGHDLLGKLEHKGLFVDILKTGIHSIPALIEFVSKFV